MRITSTGPLLPVLFWLLSDHLRSCMPGTAHLADALCARDMLSEVVHGHNSRRLGRPAMRMVSVIQRQDFCRRARNKLNATGPRLYVYYMADVVGRRWICGRCADLQKTKNCGRSLQG